MTGEPLMSRVSAQVARAVPLPPTPSRTGVRQEPTLRTRTARGAAEDLLLAIGLTVSIPAVILAIGIPIALVVRLLLWIAGLV
jgi:hypothetical protein